MLTENGFQTSDVAFSLLDYRGFLELRSDQLKLDIPETIGNGYHNKKMGVLPANLMKATEKMANSDIANQLFGEAFVDHFTKTREWEWRQFASQVTDWELKRYFEII